MSVSKKQNLPPQSGEYKVRIKKRSPNCPLDVKVLRLEISVGQPYHEGEKFKCTIDWAKHRFEKVIILVNDTLQRFNYMYEEGLSEKEAQTKSLQDGDAWIARNMPVIATLPSYEIYRWDDWKKQDGYFDQLFKARKLYWDHPEFRTAVDAAIHDIWERHTHCRHNQDEFFALSRYYLIEETAVLSMIYGQSKGVSAYPGSFQEMWEMFLDKDDPDAPSGLKHAHWMRIDFDRKDRLLKTAAT